MNVVCICLLCRELYHIAAVYTLKQQLKLGLLMLTHIMSIVPIPYRMTLHIRHIISVEFGHAVLYSKQSISCHLIDFFATLLMEKIDFIA